MKSRNNSIRWRLLEIVAVLLLASAAAHAGTVTGVVHNGTNSNKPAPNVDVLLIQLQGGMQVVANTTTDAQGQYHIDNPNIGNGPMLIRAVYKGVFFTSPSSRARPPSTSRSSNRRRIPGRFKSPCGFWSSSRKTTN